MILTASRKVGSDIMGHRKTQRLDQPLQRGRIAEQAAKIVRPPPGVSLRDQDEVHWKNIVNARLDWTDIDLAMAANLARTMSDIETNQAMLDLCGYVNERGVISAYHKAVEDLTARALRLAMKIQVHATATIGEVENNKKKNHAKQRAVKAFQQLDEEIDDLIARPN